MTDPPPPSPLGSNQSSINVESHHHQTHYLHEYRVDSGLHPSFHSNGKMRLGKSNNSPITSGELPPLVGVPHPPDKPWSNHQTTPDSTAILAVCPGALGSETPAGPGTPSPHTRRRLKYMVRQCSDSELLKNNSSLGRMKITPATSGTSSPVPHPPDQMPRSQNSSETNSPTSLRISQKFNSSWSGPNRVSRSLEASPMVVRRARNGIRRNSGDRDSPSSSVPPSSPPCSDQTQKRRPRPFSFGSYSDMLHNVGSNNDPSQVLTASPRGPGSPFVVRRTASLRGGVLLPRSRPDTPAYDASVNGSKKSNQLPTSSRERNEFEDDETSLVLEDRVSPEETTLPRRRLRRDSGSQHAQRNSIGPVSSDCKQNFPKKSQYVTAPSGINDNQHRPHYQYEEQVIDHVVDDDTGYPGNLYDIQERRESILSIEAVQEIARRFANAANDSNQETNEDDNDVQNHDEKRKCKKEKVPEYRKEPLSTDTRVSNWLKGIQDPTERVPTNIERIFPDIL